MFDLVKRRIYFIQLAISPIPLAEGSNVRFCDRSLAEIVYSYPAKDTDICVF